MTHPLRASLSLILATTVLCSAAVYAVAQPASNFSQSSFAPKTAVGGENSLPPLASPPPLPGVPAAPDAFKPNDAVKAMVPPPVATAVAEATITEASPAAAPPPPEQKESFGKAMEEPAPLADLPPALPESSDMVADVPPIPKLPDVLPQPSEPQDVPVVRVNTPMEALPEPKPEKPKEKTWLTKLAPSVIPPETRFNYRRDLLPAPIYRTGYDERNQHLPRAVTRQDYENLLFASAARNDVETTRALLNAGTNINVVASNGETPLMAARRSGAQATAALLFARGGR